MPGVCLLSSVVFVEYRVKMGGPPSKAEYYWIIDSKLVKRLKGEKIPDKGSEKT